MVPRGWTLVVLTNSSFHHYLPCEVQAALLSLVLVGHSINVKIKRSMLDMLEHVVLTHIRKFGRCKSFLCPSIFKFKWIKKKNNKRIRHWKICNFFMLCMLILFTIRVQNVALITVCVYKVCCFYPASDSHVY